MSCQNMIVPWNQSHTNADGTACCGQQGVDAGALCVVTWHETPVLMYGWVGGW